MKTVRVSSYDELNPVKHNVALENRTEITYVFVGDDLEVTDGFHTMDELYRHRAALTIALFNTWNQSILWGSSEKDVEIKVMKSRLHNDGTMYEGHFIVMAITPYGQISYHFEMRYWEYFHIPEVERVPRWDGHDSDDVADRLMKL